jgi:NhaP-type Na+/H+ or K+/H+ antiporter
MSASSQYEFLVVLLVAILVLELIARRLHLPPAAAFISGGIALALVPGVPTFSIDPDLVLLIFMPPLLMNGAYFTVWREFRENISGILLLALGAVAFKTLAVGLAANGWCRGCRGRCASYWVQSSPRRTQWLPRQCSNVSRCRPA